MLAFELKALIVFKEDAVSSTSIRLSYPQGKHVGLLDMKVMALFAVDDYPLNFKMNIRPCRYAIRTTPPVLYRQEVVSNWRALL